MSDANEDIPGYKSDANSGGSLCEIGTKGNPVESRRIREFSLLYYLPLRLLVV